MPRPEIESPPAKLEEHLAELEVEPGSIDRIGEGALNNVSDRPRSGRPGWLIAGLAGATIAALLLVLPRLREPRSPRVAGADTQAFVVEQVGSLVVVRDADGQALALRGGGR